MSTQKTLVLALFISWRALSAAIPAEGVPCRLVDDPLKAFFKDQSHPLLKLPPEFETDDVSAFLRYAKAQKLRTLEFMSHLGNRRTIFLDERDPNFDRWILHVQNGGALLDFIVVEKKKARAKPKIWFGEYIARNGKFVPNEKPQACYECHSNGLREIHSITEARTSRMAGVDADRTPDESLAERRRKDFNRKIESYGMPDWRGAYEPEKRFPGLSRSKPELTSCAFCHNGEYRGPLTPLFAEYEVRAKVIDDGSMPPHRSFDMPQRREVFDALYRNYAGDLDAWIQTTPTCSAVPPGEEDPAKAYLERLRERLEISPPSEWGEGEEVGDE